VTVLGLSVFYILPTLLLGRGIGLILMGLKIGGTEFDEPAGRMKVLWRELIAKPLSVATVLGPFLSLVTPSGRSLHDYLAGTNIYYKD
jgi:uncharacterized RDD family membrane protein YckC